MHKLYVRLFGFPPAVDTRIRARAVMRWLAPQTQELVLDVGCGFGIYSIECAVKGAEIVAIDISREAVKTTLRAAKAVGCDDKTHPIVADCLNLPLLDDLFDKITCVEVLEQIVMDEEAMRELSRVLRRQRTSRLIITTPRLNIRPVLPHILKVYKKPNAFGCVREGYSKEGLIQKAIRAGLRPLHVEYTHGRFGRIIVELGYLLDFVRLSVFAFPLLYPLALLASKTPKEEDSRPIQSESILLVARHVLRRRGLLLLVPQRSVLSSGSK